MLQILSIAVLVWIVALMVRCGQAFVLGRMMDNYTFKLHGGFVIAAVVLPSLIRSIGKDFIDSQCIQLFVFAALLGIATYALPPFFCMWGSESKRR